MYHDLKTDGTFREIFDYVAKWKPKKPFDFDYNSQEGALLLDLHWEEMHTVIHQMLRNSVLFTIKQKGRLLEVVVAKIADKLKAMGVKFDVDAQVVTWSDGTQRGKQLDIGNFIGTKKGRPAKRKIAGTEVADRIVKKFAEKEGGKTSNEWPIDEKKSLLAFYPECYDEEKGGCNFVMLSEKLAEQGFTKKNDLCRHQINKLKERYQQLVMQEKQTGNGCYDDPLRPFLITAFGPFKDVDPDYVLSNRKGGSRCKPMGNGDGPKKDTDDSDDEAAVAVAESKKSRKIRVKSNKTSIEKVIDATTIMHEESMKSAKALGDQLDRMVQLQEMRLMKELGMEVDPTNFSVVKQQKMQVKEKRSIEISSAQKIVAAEMQKIYKL